jgi:hypothetical protein
MAWSASGLVSLLSFFGFWMGGALLLVVTARLALWYATSRQRAARHAIILATAFVVGVVPGAWRGAAGLEAFWGELLFPLGVGALLALTRAPSYVALARRVALREHRPSAI